MEDSAHTTTSTSLCL